MPFINGKFYASPAYGLALERARLRAAGSENSEPEVVSAQEAESGHWVTINHHHVFVRERQDTQPRMALSPHGLEFIQQYENLRLTRYADQAGHETIGCGHKIQPGENYSKGITEAQAHSLLEKDAQGAVNAVNSALERPVTQDQFDALVSFTYNVGPTRLRRSTLLAKINAGQSVSEGDFTEYDHAGGHVSRELLNRRVDEYNLFSQGGRRRK